MTRVAIESSVVSDSVVFLRTKKVIKNKTNATPHKPRMPTHNGLPFLQGMHVPWYKTNSLAQATQRGPVKKQKQRRLNTIKQQHIDIVSTHANTYRHTPSNIDGWVSTWKTEGPHHSWLLLDNIASGLVRPV